MKTKLTWSFVAAQLLFLAFCFVYASDWGYVHRAKKRIQVTRDRGALHHGRANDSRASVGYDPYFCRVNDFRLPPLTLGAMKADAR